MLREAPRTQAGQEHATSKSWPHIMIDLRQTDQSTVCLALYHRPRSPAGPVGPGFQCDSTPACWSSFAPSPRYAVMCFIFLKQHITAHLPKSQTLTREIDPDCQEAKPTLNGARNTTWMVARMRCLLRLILGLSTRVGPYRSDSGPCRTLTIVDTPTTRKLGMYGTGGGDDGTSFSLCHTVLDPMCIAKSG